jgi:hypothetical protein
LEYLPTPHLKEDLPATFYDGIRKKSETTFDNVKGRRNCVALDLSFRQPAADPQAAQNFAVPALSGSGGAFVGLRAGVLDRVCGPDINRLHGELGLPPFDGSSVGGGNLSLHRFRLEATCMIMGTIVVLFNPSEHQVTNLIRIKQLCAQVIAIDNSPSSDHKQHAQIEAGCRCLRGTPRGGQFWAVA